MARCGTTALPATFRRSLSELAGNRCQVAINGVKLHGQATDSVCSPDVLVDCGGGTADETKRLTDATPIVEVSSESSAQTDRREKRAASQRLHSLRACWIISQGLLAQELALTGVYTGTDLA